MPNKLSSHLEYLNMRKMGITHHLHFTLEVLVQKRIQLKRTSGNLLVQKPVVMRKRRAKLQCGRLSLKAAAGQRLADFESSLCWGPFKSHWTRGWKESGLNSGRREELSRAPRHRLPMRRARPAPPGLVPDSLITSSVTWD